jgi:1-acyl-sn-glycerol-3-phosphate acyltransferase
MPHLRSIPGGKSEKADTSEVDAFKASLEHIEKRLASTLHAATQEAAKTHFASAEARLNKQLHASLRAFETRIREEIRALRVSPDGDVADEINRILGALETAASFERSREGLRKLRDRLSSLDVDPYGFDPAFAARMRPLIHFLFKTWFRTEVRGLERLPKGKRVLFVSNHAGTLPLDGIMLSHALHTLDQEQREVRALVEDFVFHFPFLGVLMNRLGHVRACQENAERMLQEDRAVAVFPEGIKGAGKLWRDRYRLQRFARGGFIKLALRTQTPIVPVAITGAEEAYPLLARVTFLVKALGIPYLPITPLFPWFGALGLVPLPAKWTISFGEAIDLSAHDASAAEDRIFVNHLTEQVRASVQALLKR